MNILVSFDAEIGQVNDWLDFNDIRYQNYNLWSSDYNRFCWPTCIEQSILVVPMQILLDSLSDDLSKEEIINFCRQGNQIWCTHGVDSGATIWQNQIKIIELDSYITKNSIVLISDAGFTESCQLTTLVNIKIVFFNFWTDWLDLRYQSSSLNKVLPQYDFLLTMLKKKDNRPGRDELWQELHCRPELTEHGLISYLPVENIDQWIGKKPKQHNNKAGHASMDLYLNCYFEIVPECISTEVYDFSEKTVKPIMTKTPFLIVSSPYHLKWLQHQGFKTFGALIDESYDLDLCMQDRVKHIVDVVNDIVNNGSKEFYLASKDILDHNFSRLCELNGSQQIRFDEMMFSLLNSACQPNRVSSSINTI